MVTWQEGEEGRGPCSLLCAVLEEQQPHEVSVALCMRLRGGRLALEENLTQKGGFIRLGPFWCRLPPWLASLISKTRC